MVSSSFNIYFRIFLACRNMYSYENSANYYYHFVYAAIYTGTYIFLCEQYIPTFLTMIDSGRQACISAT